MAEDEQRRVIVEGQAPDDLPLGVIRSWLAQMAFRVDLESRQMVVLAPGGLTIGRDDHAFIVREQDFGASSDYLIDLGDGDRMSIICQLSGHVNLDRMNHARDLRQDPSECALLVDGHVTRSTVDPERALKGQFTVLEMVECREVGSKVVNVTNVKFGVLYELMGMSWMTGVRSKIEVWIRGVLFLRDRVRGTVREVACYVIAAVGVFSEDHVFAVLAEGSKGRSRAGLHGFIFGGDSAVLADFEVLILSAALFDDKQLLLVGGVEREPRG